MLRRTRVSARVGHRSSCSFVRGSSSSQADPFAGPGRSRAALTTRPKLAVRCRPRNLGGEGSLWPGRVLVRTGLHRRRPSVVLEGDGHRPPCELGRRRGGEPLKDKGPFSEPSTQRLPLLSHSQLLCLRTLRRCQHARPAIELERLYSCHPSARCLQRASGACF